MDGWYLQKNDLANARGFSLIELMVAVAIIGVLTTTITLASRGFKERAYDTVAQRVATSVRTAVASNGLASGFSLSIVPGETVVFTGAASVAEIIPGIEISTFEKEVRVEVFSSVGILVSTGHCRGRHGFTYAPEVVSMGNADGLYKNPYCTSWICPAPADGSELSVRTKPLCVP